MGRAARTCCVLLCWALLAAGAETASDYRNQALAFAQKREWDQAIAVYRKALVLDPRDASTHYNLALALKYKGDAREAVEEFTQAATLKPDWPAVHYGLGAAYCDRGDSSEGKLELRRAIELDPKNVAARLYLAGVLLRENHVPEA